MQQGLQFDRGGIEVARLTPQHEVRRECGAGRHVTAEPLVIVRIQHEPAGDRHGREHDGKRGENPAHAARIEVREAEAALSERAEDDP